MKRPCCLVVICLFLAPLLCGFCYEDAAVHYDIPSDLLLAVIMAESKGNPRALGVNRSKDGSIKSVDVGLCQINTAAWKKELGPQRWNATVKDPCYNIYVGAWILAQCRNKHGNIWSDVLSCYNTGRGYTELIQKRQYKTARKAHRYITDVHNELQRIQGAEQ